MRQNLLLVFALVTTASFSQVKDISFTFSPVAEHVWWDSQAGLSDDFLYGGKVGFGVGEYLEINGLFMTSSGLTTDFSSFGLENFEVANLQAMDARLTRWGGEAKINFSTSSISPYATVGTGIQKIGLRDANSDTEQIYASFGLGLRFALSKRINFLLEARATGFQYNAGGNLLTDDQMDALGVISGDFERENLVNFGALAALQFYLGGRKPGELSELDKAYLDKLKGGFKGWSWAIEPSLGYLSVDSNSLFRNSWMAGGYFGVDFNEYVGVRAFFFQALEDGNLGLKTDPLNMYGLELRAKLNDGNGVNPYLLLGGGRLNPSSNYEGAIPQLSAQSSNFANAGLGLDIPLGRNFLITGAIRAMATSGVDVNDLTGPEDLQTHVLYNFGVKLQLGKKVDTSFSYEDEAEAELAILERSLESNDKEYLRLKKLINDYEEEIKQLDKDLEKAYQQNQTSKAVTILEDKRKLNQSLSEVKKLQRRLQTPESEKGKYYKMTPEEFESLIDRILEGIDKKYAPQQTSAKSDMELRLKEVQLQMSEYRRLLEESYEGENASLASSPNDKPIQKSEEDLKAENEILMIIRENNEEAKAKQAEIDTRLEAIQSELDENLKRLDKQDSKIESKEKEVESIKKEAKKSQKEIDSKIDKLQKEVDEFASRLKKQEESSKSNEEEN